LKITGNPNFVEMKDGGAVVAKLTQSCLSFAAKTVMNCVIGGFVQAVVTNPSAFLIATDAVNREDGVS